MIFRNIREAIIFILDKKNISKYKLASKLGYTSATSINNILSGKTTKPREWVLDSLYSVFDIQIEGEFYAKS